MSQARNTNTCTKPIWVTMAQALVNQAQRDLVKKARLAAQVKDLYTLDKRATLKFGKGANHV